MVGVNIVPHSEVDRINVIMNYNYGQKILVKLMKSSLIGPLEEVLWLLF